MPRDNHKASLSPCFLDQEAIEHVATRQLAAIVDDSDDAIISTDLDGVITSWNFGALQIFGYRANEAIGQSMNILIPPESRNEEISILKRIKAGERVSHFETVRIGKDDTHINVSVTVSPICNSKGEVVGASQIARDITQQILDKNRLKLLEICLNHTNDVVMVTEGEPISFPGPRTIYVNDAFERMTGYSREEIIGSSPRLLQGLKSDPATMHLVHEALINWKPIKVEMLNYTKSGQEFWVELSITPVADERGWFTHWVSVQRNITEKVRLGDELKALALFDPLSKLANRRLLEDHLSQALTVNRRNSLYGALIYIDLDHFKSSNDQHGHEFGDLCLIEAAKRITACVREMDTVSRIGGDEFAVLLSPLGKDESAAKKDALMVCEKIRIALGKPFIFERQDVSGKSSIDHQGSASIGLSMFAGHELSNEIIQTADSAMYDAKHAGGNKVQLYQAQN
ncbi:PAS domain S-box protein [Polynucleobacter arcticus]|uniref:Diguanylate cyclase with PAS/PAC sensor n=1 Tax=Polynucleobacter arcticus TaxID=1743165 RepID=A0A6M9PW29_9BURK|nr:PAS domain S-box protein [Polynucleobacter arcticus]QKM60173.1 hypothetical protein DN92_03450 [Polynucleobacter arcticus]